eukprot:scaffold56259_cov64-Phaeocystis_antarctica.AAC.4
MRLRARAAQSQSPQRSPPPLPDPPVPPPPAAPVPQSSSQQLSMGRAPCPSLGSLSIVPVPVQPRPGCERSLGGAIWRPSAALLRSHLRRRTRLRNLSSSAMTSPAPAPPHAWCPALRGTTACRPQPM